MFDAELDLHSWLQRIAFLTGGYEDDTVQFLLDLHRRDGRGGYLLDVGANIGLIAIPFAKSLSRPSRPVIAVEAIRDNVTALRVNIALNELESSIAVLPFGVGDEAKSVFIQVEGDLADGEGTGTANILAVDTTHECMRQELRIVTIDALQASGELPAGCAVMKIDTDGYDLKVLEGGRHFLAQNRPVIFGEFSEHCLRWHGQSVTDVATFCWDAEYSLWRRLAPGWRFVPYAPDDPFSQDLLLVPVERQGDFDDLLETSSPAPPRARRGLS